jgi:hypothetical protein
VRNPRIPHKEISVNQTTNQNDKKDMPNQPSKDPSATPTPPAPKPGEKHDDAKTGTDKR